MALTTMQESTPDSKIEKTKRVRCDDALHQHDRWDNFFDQTNEAAIKISETALKTAILINGGAVISLLAFIGAFASKDRLNGLNLKGIVDGLACFGTGVLLAAVGIGLAYVTHFLTAGWADSHSKEDEPPFIRRGPSTSAWAHARNVAHVAAFLAGLGALGAFFWGLSIIKSSLLGLFP
jgi:hypothetical protein